MSEVNGQELLDGIKREISFLFKDKAEKAKEELDYWTQKILALKLAKIDGTPEQVKELEKSEQYAYNALRSLYAEMAGVIDEAAWNFAEKLLGLLKRVLLSI